MWHFHDWKYEYFDKMWITRDLRGNDFKTRKTFEKHTCTKCGKEKIIEINEVDIFE